MSFALLPLALGEVDDVRVTFLARVDALRAMRALSRLAVGAFLADDRRGDHFAPPSFRFLSAAGTEEETEFFGDEETKSDEDIYYYEIDPNERFRITKVIAFQIGLTDPEGFLAKRLGTGIVDVVITESNLEIMITFHAHGKYYTCLMNGGGKTNYQFSTHKYIEGFNIVKNFGTILAKLFL